MKKINKDTTKGLIIGFIGAIIILSIIPVAAATINEIKVAMGGIKIYVDGNVRVPTDVNGNIVEPMIYNGTTYLPVRALTNMLTEKKVDWDGNSRTVFIGDKPNAGQKSVLLDELDPYDISWAGVYKGKDAQFNLLNEVKSPFNKLGFKWTSNSGSSSYTRSSATYILNSDYSTINGHFVEPYTRLGSTGTACIQFYSVDQYGEKTLIESYNTKAADEPMEISVPVLGVNILRIEMARTETSSNSAGAFYDVTLTTAN